VGRRAGPLDPAGSINGQELWLFVKALGKRTGLCRSLTALQSRQWTSHAIQHNKQPAPQALWDKLLSSSITKAKSNSSWISLWDDQRLISSSTWIVPVKTLLNIFTNLTNIKCLDWKGPRIATLWMFFAHYFC